MTRYDQELLGGGSKMLLYAKCVENCWKSFHIYDTAVIDGELLNLVDVFLCFSVSKLSVLGS